MTIPFGVPKLGWTELTKAGLGSAVRLLDEAAPDGVRDELGLGAIHFAYAERFFPGTSVLQTRPRYLWLVCWAYEELSELHAGRPFPHGELRSIEERTGRRLMKGLENDKAEGSGIIGWRRYQVGAAPVVMPSRIYWNALKQWGVLQDQWPEGAPPDQSSLHARWDVLVPRHGRDSASPSALFRDLPPCPDDWVRAKPPLRLDMEPIEAKRLREILAGIPCRPNGVQPLLAVLARTGVGADATAPWSPDILAIASAADRAALRRAEQAASLVCLARALYAAMIEELKATDLLDKKPVKFHRSNLWTLHNKHHSLATTLDVGTLEGDGVKMTADFSDLLKRIQDWAAKGGDYAHLVGPFRKREFSLKGSRAALAPSASARRANWQQARPAQPLDYRWPVVARCLADAKGRL